MVYYVELGCCAIVPVKFPTYMPNIHVYESIACRYEFRIYKFVGEVYNVNS